ncbi:hypothetical protein [Engelhardtia mirabilis]|uniref:hypothetical protein n=1 Tax=Engelhardtia mirabilis TaxID=2528011 RepID=UPI0011A22CF0
MLLRSTGLATGLAALALATACASQPRKEVTVSYLINQADYNGALALAQERAADAPDDQATQADLTRAQVAILLDRARRANFEGRYADSIELLEQAEALWPGQSEIALWRTKSVAQQAEYLREHARDAEATGDFESAYADFAEADRIDPDSPSARIGTERVLLRANHREGLGDAYYRKGVRALREYRAAEAVQNLDAALKYSDDPRHVDRRSEAASLLAEERMRIAEEFERQLLFRAARNEYRLAKLIVDDLPDADGGLERTTVEIQVLDFLDEADRALILDKFDLALVRVERAAAITTVQADAVEAKRKEVVEAKLRHLYQEARELESDYAVLPAIAAYDELLEEAEGFYDDAIARRDSLQQNVELAGRLYQLANEAESTEDQLDYLRRINLFWPTYRDVATRLKALGDN